jgi:hypothetical protein
VGSVDGSLDMLMCWQVIAREDVAIRPQKKKKNPNAGSFCDLVGKGGEREVRVEKLGMEISGLGVGWEGGRGRSREAGTTPLPTVVRITLRTPHWVNTDNGAWGCPPPK